MVKIIVNPQPERYLSLFQAAGAEVGIDYDIKPDWATYKALIEAKDYWFIGAEENHEPIGYIGILLTPSLFNRAVTFAIIDSFFVKPHYRFGMTAGRLIAQAEKIIGPKANRFVFQCEANNSLASVLIKRGFKVSDCNFEKVIRHG